MFKNLSLLVVSVLISLVVAEVALRLLGYSPLSIDTSKTTDTGGLADFTLVAGIEIDSQIGWVTKPGSYDYEFYGYASKVNNLKGSGRQTRKIEKDIPQNAPKIVFLGDSYTNGVGLSDHETFAWKVQEQFPHLNVINFSVGGHSTCQTLLLLKRLLKEKTFADSTFILGLSDFLELRNYPDPRIDLRTSRRSPYKSSLYPRCFINESGSLSWSPPFTWGKENPLSYKLATALAAELLIRTLSAPRSLVEQRKIAFEIIREIGKELNSQNAKLIVFMQRFNSEARSSYEEFFRHEKIDFLAPEKLVFMPEMTFPDGHPNPKLNKIWAKRLTTYLSKLTNPS